MRMIKTLFSILILFSCQKDINPKVFYNIGETHDNGEMNFSTREGIAVISFPNQFGRCIIKLYPESSINFSDAYIKLKKVTVKISSHSGVVFVLSEGCNIEVGEDISCNGCEMFLKNKNLEVIDGETQYKGIVIRKGFGYIPSEGRMYVLKPKINLVFPRDKQEVAVPLFLWEKRNDVERYFIEFALDPEFLNPVYYVSVVEDNKFFPDQMTLKILSKKIFWRIIYEDKNGIGGFPSNPQEIIVP